MTGLKSYDENQNEPCECFTISPGRIKALVNFAEDGTFGVAFVGDACLEFKSQFHRVMIPLPLESSVMWDSIRGHKWRVMLNQLYSFTRLIPDDSLYWERRASYLNSELLNIERNGGHANPKYEKVEREQIDAQNHITNVNIAFHADVLEFWLDVDEYEQGLVEVKLETLPA
jgi:hypothetical protein